MKITIKTTHDYVSVVTPNGTFTANRSGYKATGLITEAFQKIAKWFDAKLDENLNTGQIMELLATPKVMTQLFPNWNKQSIVVIAGDKVRFNNALYSKKYPSTYEVVKVKTTNVFIRTEQGVIGFNKCYLSK